MERAVSAIDDLKKLGDRLMVFEDDDVSPPSLTIVKFPENRGTMLYKGVLYDWYGREVELGKDVKRIIEPFGHYTDGIDLSHCHDNFVIELVDGTFAISGIKYYRLPKSELLGYSGLKYAITGGALKMTPHIYIDETLPHYERIELDVLKGTCFEIFKRWNGPHEYAFGVNPIFYGSADKGVTHLICGELAGGNGRCWFSVAENRNALLKTTKTGFGHMQEPDLYLSMDEFFDEIIVSEDGNKLTAIIPKKHFAKESIRISTDAEVLGHMEESHFWWYLDPI